MATATTRGRAVCILRLAAASLAWASTAQAFSTGIATTSFPVPSQACNFCHGGGSAPVVTLECVDCGGSPPAVDPLSAHEFKLTVFEVGLQNRAGLNVSSALGVLSTGGAESSGTQAVIGSGSRQEITHTAPKLGLGGMTEFSFLWTAPASPGSATLVAWGNAVNGDGSTAGDAASNVSLIVAVSGDTPTPTETPTAGPPTPTPTPTLPAGCPSTAATDCAVGFAEGLLLVKQDVPGKEKLVAKLLRGPALAQTDMGNPLAAIQGGTGTSFSLCLYDADDNFAGGVLVDRAGDFCGASPCWKPIGKAPNDPQGPGLGYKYRDPSRLADGVLRIRYKGGDLGRSKAIVVGKGSSLPAGLAAALSMDPAVRIQVRSSDGTCLSRLLDDVRVQQPSFIKIR